MFRCPSSMVDEPTRRLMVAYRSYGAGFLPAPGGMSDQAASFVRWIGVIEAERAAIEDEREARRRARRGGS